MTLTWNELVEYKTHLEQKKLYAITDGGEQYNGTVVSVGIVTSHGISAMVLLVQEELETKTIFISSTTHLFVESDGKTREIFACLKEGYLLIYLGNIPPREETEIAFPA